MSTSPGRPEASFLIAYALAVRLDRRAYGGARGDGGGLERQLAPRMQTLLESILALRLPQAPRLVPEYEQKTIGRPDLAFKRDTQPARGFIELKQLSTSLEPRDLRGHDRDQFRRFQELPLWAHRNFRAIRLHKNCESTLLPGSVAGTLRWPSGCQTKLFEFS